MTPGDAGRIELGQKPAPGVAELTRSVGERPGDGRVQMAESARPVTKPSESQATAATAQRLTTEQEAQIAEMQARDREVRNHEEAHARVGGEFAGTPSYTYQTGPDGKRYAVGGEVPIDVAPVPDDPEATIAKMEVVKAAALAPAEPSGQDRQVAAAADANRMQAIADLAELRRAVKDSAAEPGVDVKI